MRAEFGVRQQSKESTDFVQPDRPVDLVLVVYPQLLAKNLVPRFVDLFGFAFAVVEMRLCVYGSEFAVPAGHFVVDHELCFAYELLLELDLLLCGSSVGLAPGEAHCLCF